MILVEHIEFQTSDHDGFVAAMKRARATLIAARGCRSVDVTRSGDVYRARIEWRSAADREALDVAAVDGALAPFERRARSVDTPIDLCDDAIAHDRASLRRAFGQFPTGVAVIAAMGPRGPAAMLVSSFTSVSLEPTIVSFCAAHTSTSWPIIADAKSCTVNVLAATQTSLVKQLSSPAEERFAGVAFRPSAGGAPILDGTVGWMDCRIAEVRASGDHDLALLDVRAYEMDPTVEPLVFHRSGFRVLSP